MLETHIEYLTDVVVLERIVALLAVPADFDKILLPEHAQLMGYGALLHADDIRDTADAELALEQRAHYANAGLVAENFEEIRELKERVGVRHTALDLVYYAFMFFLCHIILRFVNA